MDVTTRRISRFLPCMDLNSDHTAAAILLCPEFIEVCVYHGTPLGLLDYLGNFPMFMGE